MKNKFAKILTLVLSVIMLFSSTVGCKKEAEHPTLPDYTERAKSYDFYAYSGPDRGWFSRDGEIFVTGPDKRTKEGYTTYKEAGFNIVLLGGSAGVETTTWQNSEAKRAADALLSAGIDRWIMVDYKLVTWADQAEKLVGNGCTFKDEEALYQAIKEQCAEYMQYEGFYGIKLRDEPHSRQTDAIGAIARCLYRLADELKLERPFLELCLVGYGPSGMYYGDKAKGDYATAYVNDYIKGYLESTGVDAVTSDFYWFRENNQGNYLSNATTCIRLLKKVLDDYSAEKEKDLGLNIVLQSFELFEGKSPRWRRVCKSDMMMEMYTMMGHGATGFSYYTYMPAEASMGSNTPWGVESCFITNEGKKTNVYYYGQELMSWAQEMGKILLNYDFKGSLVYNCMDSYDRPANFSLAPYIGDTYLNGDEELGREPLQEWLDVNAHEFTHVKGVEFDNDVVLVSELYDDVEDLYCYMVQNIVDPSMGYLGSTDERVTVTFDSQFTHVAEIKDGRITYVALEDGVYSKTLSAGHAVFLIPLK